MFDRIARPSAVVRFKRETEAHLIWATLRGNQPDADRDRRIIAGADRLLSYMRTAHKRVPRNGRR